MTAIAKPAPLLLAMIVCDTVIVDAATQKKSLIGLFSRIQCARVPHQHGRMFVYVVLTEGIGSCRHQLRCLHSEDNKILFAHEGEVQFKDRMQNVELVYDLSGMTFPAYGLYRFEFWGEDKLLGARQFVVALLDKRSRGKRKGPDA